MNFDPRPIFFGFCFFILMMSVLMMVRTCKRDFISRASGPPQAWADCQKASSNGIRLGGC